MEVTVFASDIIRQSAEAIVNAANSQLRHGGGIDDAIRTAAGPEMDDALSKHRWLSEGSAIVTPGFRLPAKWVIHTAAPHWHGKAGPARRDETFRACHRACLEAAARIGARSIAFPAIGTGSFGWPARHAASLAFEAVAEWLDDGHPLPATISFVCPSDAFAAFYAEQRSEWLEGRL